MARISGATHRTRITRGRVALISNRICRECREIQDASRWSRYVKICQDMSRYVKICQDMSRYVKICQDMSRYVKICQDMSRWQKPSYTPALCLQASTKTIANHYTSASIGIGLWSNHYRESPQHTRHTTVSFYITAVTAPEDFRSDHSDLRLAPVGTVFLCALYSFLSPGAESAEPQPCAARGAEERSIAARPKRGRSTAEHS